jgi:hypothetical protein
VGLRHRNEIGGVEEPPSAIWWVIAQRRGAPKAPARMASSSSVSRINETFTRSG